jgi:hypothetical protein
MKRLFASIVKYLLPRAKKRLKPAKNASFW